MLLKECVLVEACQIYSLEEGVMTKAELIDQIAKDAKATKAAAGKALDSFVDGVKKAARRAIR